MTQYTVNSASLREQSSNVTNAATEIQSRLSAVTGQIQELATHWTGGASAAFQGLWQDWNTNATQLIQSMADMGEFLLRAAETFETAEEQVAQGTGR